MKHADTESVGDAINQDDQKSRYHSYDKVAHCHWSTISDFCASAQVLPWHRVSQSGDWGFSLHSHLVGHDQLPQIFDLALCDHFLYMRQVFVSVKPVSSFGEADRSRVVMQHRLHHRAFVMNSGMKQSGHFCFPLRRKHLKPRVLL